MKKKAILIFVIIAIFAFTLAISVMAEDRTIITYTDFDGVTHIVPVVKYEDATAESVSAALNNNATVQARFIDNGAYSIVKAKDGTLTAYPTWYFIEPSGSSASYVAISEIEYEYVNLKSGNTYERGSLVYVEFPHGMTAVRNNSVFGKNNGNPYETNVTDFYIPSSVTSIESNTFNKMLKLRNVFIEAGNQIKTIPSGTFSNSSVQYIQFENLTELESIDGCTNTGLTGDIDLSKTKLKTIKSGAFEQSIYIGKITLPDTVEVIENNAFQNTGNAYLASPYLPKNLKSIGQRFFAYNNNLLDTYIFPEGVTQLPNEPFQDSKVGGGPEGKKLNLVFLGEVTGVVYLNGNGHQKHAEEVTVYFAKNSLSQYNQNGFYVKPSGSSYTDVARAIRVVFCNGSNSADLIYLTNTSGSSWENGTFTMDAHTHFGSHTVLPNDCGNDGSETLSCVICDTDIVSKLEATNEHSYIEGVCAVCGKIFCPGGDEHSMKQTVIFDSGFLSSGRITSRCQNENCTYEIKESDLEPIFVFKGYSAKISGDKITVSYLINKDSYNAYKNINQGTLDFGVIATIANNGAFSPIRVEDNKLTTDKNVVFAPLDSIYTGFDFILNGFTSEHYSKALIMCAYVYDGKNVSYLCFNDVGDAGQYDKAYAITFDKYAK